MTTIRRPRWLSGSLSSAISSALSAQTLCNLAVIRIIFFSILYFTMVQGEYFLHWTEVPDAFWFPRGLYRLLPAPPSRTLITGLFYFWKVTTFFGIFGLFYRWIAPLWWVSSFLVTMYGHSFGYQGHVFMPVVVAALPLAFSRASEVFSLDYFIRLPRGPREFFDVSGDRVAIRAMQLALVLAYFAAGVAKVRHGGWQWVSGDTLQNFMIRSSVNFSDTNSLAHFFSLNDRLIQFPILCHALAAFAIGIELAAPLAFFWRKASYVVIPLLVCLQVGIFFTMYVRFTPYFALTIVWINWWYLIDRKFNDLREI